jgi:MinD superfamily P-loop ATPase
MRTVVVASGKGGTGKTTMTAVFAHLAAAHHRVVVADADVEAANLPLALRVRDASCETFSGISKATIDVDTCTACGLCAEACRFGAVLTDPSGKCRVDPFSCEGCRACMRVCPAGAIEMTPSIAGEACRGESAVGPIAFGQLGPGEDLSGKLVTEVRRLASQAAEHAEADLLLIDGPPGVGCPLIAAISSTDLLIAIAEPTVSGAHDLERLAELAQRLRIPARVVLNKADLSDQGAAQIRRLCAALDLPLIAEVPFDATLAGLLEKLAQATGSDAVDQEPALRGLADMWRSIERDLGM